MSISKILKAYAEKVIAGAKKTLKEKNAAKESGGNASSALSQSIRFLPLKIFGSSFQLTWVGEDYWFWVNHGRKAGKFPPRKAIEQWITEKGLINRQTIKAGIKRKSKLSLSEKVLSERRSLAFLIGRKLKAKGYKGSKFFTNQVNKESLTTLRNDLSAQIGKDAILELTEHIKEIQK